AAPPPVRGPGAEPTAPGAGPAAAPAAGAGPETGPETGSETAPETGPGIDPADDALLRRIGLDPVDLDTLGVDLDWPIDRLLGRLTLLEIAGRIERTADGRYRRRP
ncbi:DprA-like winged helix domain-containing protein, partial [Castellaniella defragrans]